jgi:hypothetical protein
MVMSSIFIQIPSYHDYEIGRTIRDAIKKSSGNNTINFGLHVSYYRNNDLDIPILDNVKVKISEAPDNLGQGTSRHIANEFYNGEDYYLQIDSHTRFEKNWDESLIENYNFYKGLGLKTVISAYPGSYEYGENGLNILNEKAHIPYTDFVEELSFQDNCHIPHQRAVPNLSNNIFTRSVSGGSIFSDGSIASIKPNKDMYFWGEEILTAVRLYTHGYDLLLPKKQNLYHLYYDKSRGEKNLRRQVGEDFPDLIKQIDDKSKYELGRILDNKIIGPDALGSVRTLEEYQTFAGINFVDKKIVPVL